jgi:hypothetical protein
LLNTTEKEVREFLKEFKDKKKIWGIVFLDDRGKNFEMLSLLDIRPIDREKVLDDLAIENYFEGPKPEEMYGTKEMWVFGQVVKGKEIYIKITKGIPSSNTLCISFHIAEYKLNYPFKIASK